MIGRRLTAVGLVLAMGFELLTLPSCGSKPAVSSALSTKSYSSSTSVEISASSLLAAFKAGIPGDEKMFDALTLLDIRPSSDGYTVLWENESDVFVTQLGKQNEVTKNTVFEKEKDKNPLRILYMNDTPCGILFQKMSGNSWDTSYYLECFGSDVPDGSNHISSLDNTFVIDAESGKNDQVYFLTADSLVVYSLSDNSEKVVDFEKGRQGLGISMDDKGIALVTLSDGKNTIIEQYIEEKAQLVETAKIKDVSDLSINEVLFTSDGKDKSVFLSTYDGLYEYSFASQAMMTVFQYAEKGIALSSPPIVLLRSSDEILVWGSVEASEYPESTEGLYKIQFRADTKDKTTITVGVLDDSTIIDKSVSFFNENNDSVKIEVRAYGDYSACATQEDYDKERKKAENALRVDALSSNTPDILYVYPEMLYSLEKDDALVDLNPILSEDDALDETEYTPNIWDSEVSSDGNRYSISPYFSLDGFLDQTESGIKVPYTFDDLAALAGETHMSIFDGNKSSTILVRFYPWIQNSFIDKEKGVASFTDDDFLSFLEWSKDYGNTNKQESHDSKALLQWASLDSFGSFLSYYGLKGDSLHYIGYPDRDEAGLTILTECCFCISKSSVHQKEAWEYLSFLLSDTAQNMRKDWGNNEIPIMTTACENMISSDMEEYKNYKTSGIAFNGSEIEYPTLTSEEFKKAEDLYWSYINNAVYAEPVDMFILFILREECEPYYNGEKTAAETINTIQSRVQLYLNETSEP